MAILKLQKWFNLKKAALFTKMLKSDFGRIGRGCLIHPPFHSNDASEVYMGKNCLIVSGGWFDTIKKYGDIDYQPRIDIGDNVYMGFRVHLNACRHIKIGNDVVIADHVFISDNLHGYEDIDKSVFNTPLVSPGPVIVEDQVWLGQAVCVMPNVTIGKHSVIGSNAVVTKNIPPYSVATGVPAKVIKQYNHQTKQWQRV